MRYTHIHLNTITSATTTTATKAAPTIIAAVQTTTTTTATKATATIIPASLLYDTSDKELAASSKTIGN